MWLCCGLRMSRQHLLFCQHQGGREPGSSGWVNPGEASINVVTKNKPKVLLQNGDNRARAQNLTSLVAGRSPLAPRCR